jgi:hypothetical protein
MILNRAVRWATILVILSAISSESCALTVGELDNFSTNLEGWSQGHAAVGMVGATRATTGGPAGAGDAFMRIQSDGSGQQGKIVVFNKSQWAGDYPSAGVAAISMAVNNLGTTNLNLRLALGTGASASVGNWYASKTSINVAAGSGWTNVQFPLGAGDLQSVLGSGSYGSVMGGVVTLRLLHATSADNNGTPVTAILGVDNIRSIPAGDYNNNGVVDVADYVVWRDRAGTANAMPNDPIGGTIGTGQYNQWKANFGRAAASGSGSGSGSGTVLSAVPEPSTAVLLAIAGAATLAARRRIKFATCCAGSASTSGRWGANWGGTGRRFGCEQ